MDDGVRYVASVGNLLPRQPGALHRRTQLLSKINHYAKIVSQLGYYVEPFPHLFVIDAYTSIMRPTQAKFTRTSSQRASRVLRLRLPLLIQLFIEFRPVVIPRQNGRRQPHSQQQHGQSFHLELPWLWSIR